MRDAELTEFFSDAENLYPTINISYNKDQNAFDILIAVETDGITSDDEWFKNR